MSTFSLNRCFESQQGGIRWDVFGDGPPIILLHGTPNYSYIWRKVVPVLRRDHSVYIFDWPGFGNSERFQGQNISWEEQPRRLVELFNHWEVENPVVVAFDFAPIFALRAHFFHGLDYKALILADAAVIPPFVTDFSKYAHDNIGVFRNVPVYVSEAMIEAHIKRTTYHPMTQTVVDNYMKPWRGEDGVNAYWRVVENYDENLSRPVSERLRDLEVPTLVLWGECDGWLPPYMGKKLAESIPGARLQMISNAGHFSPEDNPKDFAAAIEEFLGEIQ